MNPSKEPHGLYLRIGEAAQVAGVSTWTLRKAVADGTLRAKRTSDSERASLLFRVADLEDWFDRLPAA